MQQKCCKGNVPNKTQEVRMSKVNWTDEQKQAIYEDGSNILVAAAARQW